MAPRSAVLGIEGGSFFYGATKIFEDVSFVLDGAHTALVGENGAGKSTLLKCLLGELELDKGQVIRSRGLKIGTVPQDIPAQFAAMTVRDVLTSALNVQDGSDDWKVDVMLEETRVSFETAEGLFGALSGGWQRLMLIAAAAKLAWEHPI